MEKQLKQNQRSIFTKEGDKNSCIVLYGAGAYGKRIFHVLQELEIKIECFCDSDKNKIGTTIDDTNIVSPEALAIQYPDAKIFITVENENAQFEIAQKLQSLHFNDITKCSALFSSVEFSREYCKVSHIETMNSYFDNAESDYYLSYFWGKDTIFYHLFETLNLETVLELACGRGRHVQKYMDRTQHIILVDILDKNIGYCQKRFQGIDKIKYVQNNGYDLSEVEDHSCTALFTYDAMVHFESTDVYQYLLETYRVLKEGGKALFHHSNNDKDYKAVFTTGKIGRAYMSKDLFAHFCYKAGLTVLEQHVIDWGIVGYEDVVKDLDCITLVQK